MNSPSLLAPFSLSSLSPTLSVGKICCHRKCNIAGFFLFFWVFFFSIYADVPQRSPFPLSTVTFLQSAVCFPTASFREMIFYLIIFQNEFDTFLPIKWPVGGKSSLKGGITSCIPLVHSLLFICSTWLTSKSHLGNYRDVWLHTYCNMLSWMVNECTVNQYKVTVVWIISTQSTSYWQLNTKGKKACHLPFCTHGTTVKQQQQQFWKLLLKHTR